MERTKYPAAMFSDMFNENNENWLIYDQLWEFLNTDRCWDHLKLATDLGCTAVEGITDLLLGKSEFENVLNDKNPKFKRVKMMIGHMVKFVMEEHDYLPVDTVKCFKKTELFTYGMKYKKSSSAGAKTASNNKETFKQKMTGSIKSITLK